MRLHLRCFGLIFSCKLLQARLVLAAACAGSDGGSGAQPQQRSAPFCRFSVDTSCFSRVFSNSSVLVQSHHATTQREREGATPDLFNVVLLVL
jgi:hypothetical protein